MPKAEHLEDGGFFSHIADFGVMLECLTLLLARSAVSDGQPRMTRWLQVMKSALSLKSLQERLELVK